MREVILQKQHQNETQNLEEETIASIRQIIESEALQRVQNGERNDALVSSLQQNLVNLGYDLGTTGVLGNGVDGDYGELTMNSINVFEKEYARNSPKVLFNQELAAIVESNLKNGLSFREISEIKNHIDVLRGNFNVEDDPNTERLMELINITMVSIPLALTPQFR
jgi:peptidoglycan hydrolase-like protein with peptidoglycan-binding domain